MLNKAIKKINQSKIILSPFPYLFIKDFINKQDLKSVIKSLPSFNEISGNEILYQSKSQSKKTVLPNSTIYKKLSKKKSFKDINFLFEKLKPVILKKFRDQIKLHVKANFQNSNLMEANFTSSNITNANFDGANLTGATWTNGQTCGPESIGTCKQ